MYNEKIGGFEIKAFFDKYRQELVNKVTYRRKQLQTKVLDDRYSQQYIGYQLIKDDLKNVLSWVNLSIALLDKNVRTADDKVILNSLFISIVVTYWKCFADSKGRQGIQLNRKHLKEEHYGIHNELKRIRHNFAAHSGDDPFESGYLLLVTDLVGKKRFDPAHIPIHRKAGYGNNQLNINTKILVSSVIEQVEIKQEKLLQIIKSKVV